MPIKQFDVVILGGGLAGCLMAWRLRLSHPGLRLALVERGETLAGNHTWSFHHSDLTDLIRSQLTPIIRRSWPNQSVRFPSYNRTLSTGYSSVDSHRLRVVLQSVLPSNCIFRSDANLKAPLIFDARGFRDKAPTDCGFQKFVGLDLTLAQPHRITAPVLMDAQVDQIDGFRFVYLLPWDTNSLLVEDTYYSSRSELDQGVIVRRIRNYCAARGWKIKSVDRTETGVLPIPLKRPSIQTIETSTLLLGTRAGTFHYLTGYSFPWAAQAAFAVASLENLTMDNVRETLSVIHAEAMVDSRYWLALNRMLFMAAHPERRIRVFERFYRLDQSLIERFYAGRLTLLDRTRILSGRPPVPIFRALRSLITQETRL